MGAQDEDSPHAISQSIYTEVDSARQLVEATGVDSLAVSIGTVHGRYKGRRTVGFERLAELREAASTCRLSCTAARVTTTSRAAPGAASPRSTCYTDFIVAALDGVRGARPGNWLRRAQRRQRCHEGRAAALLPRAGVRRPLVDLHATRPPHMRPSCGRPKGTPSRRRNGKGGEGLDHERRTRRAPAARVRGGGGRRGGAHADRREVRRCRPRPHDESDRHGDRRRRRRERS